MRLLALLALACASAFAQFVTTSQPGAEYLTATTLIPTGLANSTTLTSPAAITGGGQSLTFSTNLTAFDAGAGLLFNPWGASPDVETTTPRILASGINQTALTINLGTPSTTFGFELAAVNRCEPAPACGTPPPGPVSSYNVTATFFNGSTNLGTVTRSVTYNSARLFAASAGSASITSVTISSPLGAGGFGIGQFRFGQRPVGAPTVTSVPALGFPELGALGLLLAAAGTVLARRATLEG